ncbi:hypothetical protein COY16_02610 [Candidatus Roizmanbacteria bacterium CG_4_10_14_0_2_um_filter_39_13]|uniref:Uncharacterized protein n=1 Tax=Candidatus Roizmanbacteria bacterium CG_4_10_14_0_2_um_filter_39_13 TaxID=1974825 RepID=A0A2M7TZC9_9BACT|nr:MAG: hypothetical protein COY16_02610 [Candidatus Roizmanbacteria bacterium CG_4_10_14_0_2_um_filter_39_13]
MLSPRTIVIPVKTGIQTGSPIESGMTEDTRCSASRSIIKRERIESEEVDVEWVQKNCEMNKPEFIN